MSGKTKFFLAILGLAAIFAVINCQLFLTVKAQAGANCFVITFIMMKLFKDYDRKKTNKAYKKTIPWLIPILFFTVLFIGMLAGIATVNIICVIVGLVLGLLIFFKSKK